MTTSPAPEPLPRERLPPEPLPRERRRLRPGLRVLRRERDVLQVGLDPARAVRLPDTPGVRRTLAALTARGPVTDHDPLVLAELDRRGALAAPGPAPVAGPVALRTYGAPLPSSVRDALAAVGVTPAGAGAPAGATVLVAGVGEPHRAPLDDLLADGTPHLLLRFTEGEALLGPFVRPGHTACLRCVDAHHAERDPRWALLVEQQAAATRDDARLEPVDPLLARLAAAWAARDLATAAQGRTPASWSTTIRLPPDLTGFEAVGWLRHPACGCGLAAPGPAATGDGSQW